MFALLVCVTAATHYYSLFFEFIMCGSVSLVFIRNWNLQKFVSVLICVLIAIAGAFIMYFIAFLKTGSVHYALTWGAELTSGNAPVFESIASVEKPQEYSHTDSYIASRRSSMSVFLDSVVLNVFSPLVHNLNSVFILLLFVFSIISIIAAILINRDKQQWKFYLSVFVPLVLFLFFYSAPAINLTRIIESYRFIICLYILSATFLCLPFDFFLSCFWFFLNSFSFHIYRIVILLLTVVPVFYVCFDTKF